MFYLIHGVPVSIQCDHPEALDRMGGLLSAYSVEGGATGPDSGIRVEIASGNRQYPVPLHAKRVLNYECVRAYHLPGKMYFTDYFSTLTLDPGSGLVRGNLSPETIRDFGLNPFVDILFTLALFEMMRFKGLYYLHASGLQDPDGHGYLISGNAGSGKTSLTLALIHSGFKFLSDDTVFLRLPNGGGVEVLGFARDFHLPLDLIEEHDFLARFTDLPDYRAERDRKLLEPDKWFPGKRLDSMADPRVMLFPKIVEGRSGVTPLSSGEAMTELLPQSLSVMFNPETAAEHLEAIKRVLAGAKGFTLHNGPDLKGSPERAMELFLRARDLALEQRGGPS